MPEKYTLRNQPVGDQTLSTLEAAEKLKIGVFISAPLLQGQLLPHVTLPKLPLVDSPALYCLQFARPAPGVVAALVGQKDPKHVEENLKITNLPPYALDEFLSIFFSRRPKDT